MDQINEKISHLAHHLGRICAYEECYDDIEGFFTDSEHIIRLQNESIVEAVCGFTIINYDTEQYITVTQIQGRQKSKAPPQGWKDILYFAFEKTALEFGFQTACVRPAQCSPWFENPWGVNRKVDKKRIQRQMIQNYNKIPIRRGYTFNPDLLLYTLEL